MESSKQARFSQINKLRCLKPSEMPTNDLNDYSVLELVTPTINSTETKQETTTNNVATPTKNFAKPKGQMRILDSPKFVDGAVPRDKMDDSMFKQEKSDPIEWDYYYLEEEEQQQQENETDECGVVRVESFNFQLQEGEVLGEYDGDVSDPYDSENEVDYPSTPDDDSIDRLFGDDSSDHENDGSSDDNDGYRHSYNKYDREEYDDDEDNY
eukprot:TRINITY_DN6326_c0_g1_i2.p2 TRINITY_DN6326_c0_g1~~TRINITY_DN6326_c0_g1_i2.p2  ORF type:complete len:211 (+),score=68.93 TRINITY_DN6326_c0_g1_i2:2010-2642(+)